MIDYTVEANFCRAITKFVMEYKADIERTIFEGKLAIGVKNPNFNLMYPKIFMGFRVGLRRRFEEENIKALSIFKSLYPSGHCKLVKNECQTSILVDQPNPDIKYPSIYYGMGVIVKFDNEKSN